MSRHLLRTPLAVAALGASRLTAHLVYRSSRRLDEWETLTCEDAEEGEFVALSDGARMHYIQRGERGTPVLLIHGLMSSTCEWDRNIDALAEHHRVWAVDLIGFGFSSRTTRPIYSLRYYARSLREFMDAIGLEQASLIGHSLGGGVALQFAHDFGSRADKLVLIAPATYIFGLFKAVQVAARIPYLPRTVAAWMLCDPRVHRSALENALGDRARLDEPMLAARIRASRVRGTLDALLAMSASPGATQHPEGLREIRNRALVIWGDRDLILPLRHGRRLARELLDAELVILEGAGHVPNEEYPQTVNTLMLDFLEKD